MTQVDFPIVRIGDFYFLCIKYYSLNTQTFDTNFSIIITNYKIYKKI
jgi:hypothetical protein